MVSKKENFWQKVLYSFLGGVSLILAIVGAFLPVLPTVPFLILASYCFSKSNERFHRWLLQHRVLGPPIQDWEKHRAIRFRTKVLVTVLILISGTISFFFLLTNKILKILVFALCVGVILFLWLGIRTRRQDSINLLVDRQRF